MSISRNLREIARVPEQVITGEVTSISGTTAK
jgi:hypothetical protein